MRNKYILLNWPFIGCLIILIINDHLLKSIFNNWITGKLSDFAGVFILPLFLFFIFRGRPRTWIYTTVFFFVFWKMPVSSNLIALYNSIALIPISRVVDYSDLIALSILPLSEPIMKNPERYSISMLTRVPPFAIALITSFAFMATSPPTSYYMRPRGDIKINQQYVIKVPGPELIRRIKATGFDIQPDSTGDASFYKGYVIKNAVLNTTDTLREIHFQLKETSRKTYVYLNSVKVGNKLDLSDWRTLRELSRYYRKIVGKEILRKTE